MYIFFLFGIFTIFLCVCLLCFSGCGSTSAYRRAWKNQRGPADLWNLRCFPGKELDWCRYILICVKWLFPVQLMVVSSCNTWFKLLCRLCESPMKRDRSFCVSGSSEKLKLLSTPHEVLAVTVWSSKMTLLWLHIRHITMKSLSQTYKKKWKKANLFSWWKMLTMSCSKRHRRKQMLVHSYLYLTHHISFCYRV